MKREVSNNRLALWGGILILLALLAGTAAAAPASTKTGRTNRVLFNPSRTKPVWVSSSAAPVDGALVAAMDQIRTAGISVASVDSRIVDVPARPNPRSPFSPRQFGAGDLPPWIVSE